MMNVITENVFKYENNCIHVVSTIDDISLMIIDEDVEKKLMEWKTILELVFHKCFAFNDCIKKKHRRKRVLIQKIPRKILVLMKLIVFKIKNVFDSTKVFWLNLEVDHKSFFGLEDGDYSHLTHLWNLDFQQESYLNLFHRFALIVSYKNFLVMFLKGLIGVINSSNNWKTLHVFQETN